MMQGGRDVVGSAARAVPFDSSAVSDKAANNSTVVVERSLEERLERAEAELACCPYIDNWSRCQQETARWSRIVADLKRQIAERDAEVSHA